MDISIMEELTKQCMVLVLVLANIMMCLQLYYEAFKELLIAVEQRERHKLIWSFLYIVVGCLINAAINIFFTKGGWNEYGFYGLMQCLFCYVLVLAFLINGIKNILNDVKNSFTGSIPESLYFFGGLIILLLIREIGIWLIEQILREEFMNTDTILQYFLVMYCVGNLFLFTKQKVEEKFLVYSVRTMVKNVGTAIKCSTGEVDVNQ